MYTICARVQKKNITLQIHEDAVFVPNLMSWFSASQMHVIPGESFCDIGAGSGLHAILAAKLGARRAYGTDINPVALRFARKNARLNKVDHICRFYSGSLAGPLVKRGIRVDHMIYNAPQFPGRAVDAKMPERLRRSVDGGFGGGDLNARFIRQAHRALLPDGRVENPIVGWASPSVSRRAIRNAGRKAYEVARVDIPVWGRGNHTRAWFLRRPGKHTFTFRYKKGADSAARMLELRLDDQKPVSSRKPLQVNVDFKRS
jgi:methylase of polypeptide subunit release factors